MHPLSHPPQARQRLSTRLALVVLSLATLFVTGCATVPISGRQQLSLVSDSQMRQMSDQEYERVISEAQLTDNQAWARQVQQVGQNIAAATERFVEERNLDITFNWEFAVIKDDDMVNAWCMPGGKIAFYTGIMPLFHGDDDVAVVMGHEVAHALARHSNERMSQQMVAGLGATALNVALAEKPAETRQMWGAAVGAGLTYGVLLPFSRKQELEADKIGLRLMAMAGYDPRAAVAFWQRMSTVGGQKPPEILSTHPSDQTRIQKIKSFLPEVMDIYQQHNRP